MSSSANQSTSVAVNQDGIPPRDRKQAYDDLKARYRNAKNVFALRYLPDSLALDDPFRGSNVPVNQARRPGPDIIKQVRRDKL